MDLGLLRVVLVVVLVLVLDPGAHEEEDDHGWGEGDFFCLQTVRWQAGKSVNVIYRHPIHVTPAMVDRNGHVNNVAYIQWMQDAAIAHARTSGCTAATSALGATWVVRAHRIEYLRPVFAGDTITVLTWVADFRKVRSLRKFKMVRAADQAVVAQAETDWVFVDAASGRPRPIPAEVQHTLPLVREANKP